MYEEREREKQTKSVWVRESERERDELEVSWSELVARADKEWSEGNNANVRGLMSVLFEFGNLSCIMIGAQTSR